MRAAPLAVALAAHVAAADPREAAHNYRGDPVARAVAGGDRGGVRRAGARARGAGSRGRLAGERAHRRVGLGALRSARRRDRAPRGGGRATVGQIHHYTAGAPRSVLDALHVLEGRDGSALLSAAYHDLSAAGLSEFRLAAALEGTLTGMRRAYAGALRCVCAHAHTLP